MKISKESESSQNGIDSTKQFTIVKTASKGNRLTKTFTIQFSTLTTSSKRSQFNKTIYNSQNVIKLYDFSFTNNFNGKKPFNEFHSSNPFKEFFKTFRLKRRIRSSKKLKKYIKRIISISCESFMGKC